MTRSIISVGTSANDGTGDTLRDAMIKINENFNETWKADTSVDYPFGTSTYVGAADYDGYLLYNGDGNPLAVTITYTGSYPHTRIEFSCGEPHSGTGNGYIGVYRYVNGDETTITEIGGFRVTSSDTNGYTYVCYDNDIRNIDLIVGQTITYGLWNKTDGTAGMQLALGMRFSARETV